MRTTIEIPDSLFKKMKTQVVQTDTTIKDFIVGLLNKEFQTENVTSENSQIVENKNGLLQRSVGSRFKNKEIERIREELNI